MQQLRKLKYCPATVEAKAKAIATKTFAAAFYGIEAAEIATAKVAQPTAAVIDVFRSRNNFHNVDWFFAAFFEDKKDLDPIVQIFTRRALQIRRTVCKKPGTKGQFLRILKLYSAQSPQQPPGWFHDDTTGEGKPPHSFPTPQDRRGLYGTGQHVHETLEADGPVGLLISSLIWNGLMIDKDFKIWQYQEEPIDLFRIRTKTSSHS